MNKEEGIICEKAIPETGEAEIMVYILPTSDFGDWEGDPKRYKLGAETTLITDIGNREDLEKKGYKLAENCYVVFPAYHMQALYHPPSVMKIDEAHPFVWDKKGGDEIYVDSEGIVTSQ